MPKDLSWFVKRIGKEIKRDRINDCCSMCDNPATITIEDDFQAQYLYDVHNELNIEYEEANPKETKS